MGKGFLLFIISGLLSLSAFGQDLLSVSYQPGLRQGKVRQFLSDIRKRTGIAVSFSEASLDTRRRVSLKGSEQTIGDVLHTVLEGTGAEVRESGGRILLVPGFATRTLPQPAPLTISGYVKDSSSGEVLIGAYVYIPGLNLGTQTNNFGFYSLTLPAGARSLAAGYIGYATRTLTMTECTVPACDIYLSANAAITEVQITDTAAQPLDHTSLIVKDINFYTSLLGENDVLKALQHLPGVQPGIEGSSGLIVRGGDPGQNLSLLDGVPLYFTDHFYGITSIYNTEALKAVDFYSGAFPARYGGRLSSITDVNTRDGNMQRLRGSAKIGLLNANLSLETPIVRDKASAIVTARRSWMDLLWRPFDNTVGIDFYDVNAKANIIVNSNNRLFLSMYHGRDQFRVADEGTDMRTRWGNSFAALKWNTIISPKLFLNTSATYSIFRYELRDRFLQGLPDTSALVTLYNGTSSITEHTIRSQLYWYLNASHKVELGLRYAQGRFQPAAVRVDGTGQDPGSGATEAEAFSSSEAVLHLEDEWSICSSWKLRAGFHWANWYSSDFDYSSLQPRLFISWAPRKGLSIYASASRMAQFLHLLSNNTSGFPTDLWMPSTARIRPESATLGTLGAKLGGSHGLSYSLELYYKQQENLLTYKGGLDIFDNPGQWESRLTQGRGWSYGAEFLVRKRGERLSAAIAYTLAWAFRQFDQLNYGKAFPYRYDRRHNLHIDGRYQIRKGIDAGAGWTFMSGEALTLPDQLYSDLDNNLLNNTVNYGLTYNYTSWNSYRLPAIHRLDLSINFTKKKGERYERTISLGIYNAYGRKNVIGSSLVQDEDGNYVLKAYSISRFIPTLSYRLQF